jgi:uncharacterized protein
MTAESPTLKTAPPAWLRPELVASWWEVFAVFLLIQSHYIYGGATIFLRRLRGLPWTSRETDAHALHLLGGECALLALLFVYLHWRGWKSSDLRITINKIGAAQGIFLGLLVLILTMVGDYFVRIWHIPSPFPPAHRFRYPDHGHLSWAAMFGHLVANALFEEVTCMAYAFNQFAAKRGPGIAIVLMLLFRASYHIWKTPAELVITVAGFLFYGLFYWKTRNIWPLIVGHCVYDLFFELSQVR